MSKLRALNPAAGSEIDALAAVAGSEDALGFLPMRAGKRDMTVVVRKRDGAFVTLSAMRPWEY
jgi:hypothetical protein